MADLLKNNDIICISTSDWNFPWGSKQQIMSRLSKTNRVLYVEYQMSFLHPLRYPYFWYRYLSFFKRLKKKDQNLFIYSPIPLLPFGLYSKTINKINQYLLALSIKRILKKIQFKNYILWIYPPWSVDLIDKLRARVVVYHCIDAFAQEKQSFARKRTIESLEKRLLKKAQYVFILSKKLYDSYKEINKNTYYLPSAVDEIFFNVREDIPLCDIDKINRPRLGIVGVFDNRLDIGLIKHIALSHPEWSIVLIGAITSNRREILSLRYFRNVYFLGKKEFKQIPYYEKKLDVCLIPYKINNFTENISPLKLYEYFALGKPIVSTKLSELEKYKGLLKIAQSKEEFVEHICDLLSRSTDNLFEVRIKIARENSWDARLQTVRQMVNQWQMA